MKRILLFFSALMLSISALWAHDVEIDGIYYNLDETNKTAEVTYRGDTYDAYTNEYLGDINIPETIIINSETYSVTSIGQGAFYGCSELTEVTIPINIKSVGSMAFQDCDALTSVIWNAKNCADIRGGDYEYSPFYNSPVESFVFGEEVEYIPGKLCDDLYNLKEIIIPNSVTTIGKNAFSDSSIEKVTFGSGVTTIGTWSFAACNALTSIEIPDNVKSIENGAFRDCKNIATITFGKGVEYISEYAFYGCTSLTSIEIPDNVKGIGSEAFYGCSALTSVKWNANIERSNNGIFQNAGSINGLSLIIGDNVRTIPNAFRQANFLKMVTIGKSVSSIGYEAFFECKNLKVVCNLSSLQITRGEPAYGYVAYYAEVVSRDTGIEIELDFVYNKYDVIIAYLGDKTLTSIELPARTRIIYSDIFNEWENLSEINVSDENQYLTSENGVLFNKDKTKLIKYPTSKTNEDYSIPNSVTSIGDYAFLNCTALNAVTIGNNVSSIGTETFKGCSKLTSITIPNSVTSIGDGAFLNCTALNAVSIGNKVSSIRTETFKGCSKLTSITIPNSVTSIGNGAFLNCTALNAVTIGNNVSSIGTETFKGCSELTSITIPNSVTYIGGNAFSQCKNLTSVIWNAKNCADFYYNYPPFYESRSTITSFTIGDSVEHIPEYLCYKMSNLSSITIPNSVTSIGKAVTSTGSMVFYGCENLKTVCNFSDLNITKGSIGYGHVGYYADLIYAYKEDDFLLDKNYIISDYLGDYNQTTIELPAIAKGINPQILSKFTNLTSITIGSEFANLNLDVFSSCNNLKDINVSTENPNYCSENGVLFSKDKTELIIYPRAKSDVSHNIPNTVTSIGYKAFKGCINLTSITIPNSVIGINTQAFEGCENLKTVCNFSDLNITKGSIEYGYVGYYADLIYAYKEDDFLLDKNYIIFDYLGDYNQTTIELPAIAKGINPHILSKFTNLTSITIGSEFANLNLDVFSSCNNLKDINVSTENPNYCSENGVLFSKDKTELIIYPRAKSDVSYNIPNTVTSIGYEAFKECSGLSSITIPKNVTYLGDRAFLDCTSLSSVEWNAITCNDQTAHVFKESPINQFTFGNEVQKIPAYLCSGMSGLDEITIPNTVTTIGAYAFSDCSNITSVIVPNKVSLIAEGAFNNCSKLISIILGQNVSMIENYAFSGCRKLRDVTSYAEVVPETGYEEIFENYNANLYVPCDALEDYYYDVTFGSFKDNSQCMSAEEVKTGDKVEIEVDDRNNATVTWPSNKNAKTYNLVISKDGEVVCTLYFNRDGRLNSIDFNRSAPAEQEGFKFTVTGLEGASRYGYLMSALGEADNVIEEHTGNFTTNGSVDITETLADANITVSGGTISADADFSIYNTIGQDVTAFNGSLQPGIYLVSIENNIVKVMVH